MAHPGVVQCATCTALHGNPGRLLDIHPTDILLREDLISTTNYSQLGRLRFGKVLNLAQPPRLGSAALTRKPGPGSRTTSHTLAHQQMVPVLSQGGRGGTMTIVPECLFPSVRAELGAASRWSFYHTQTAQPGLQAEQSRAELSLGARHPTRKAASWPGFGCALLPPAGDSLPA